MPPTAQQVKIMTNVLTLGVTVLGCDSIERLRQILAKQQRRQVSYDEAQEIGDSLVEFYKVLAEEVEDEPAD